MVRFACYVAQTFAVFGLLGCELLADVVPPSVDSASVHEADNDADEHNSAEKACRKRLEAVNRLASAAGATAFDKDRIGFLGRARSEPVVFVKEPQLLPVAELSGPAQAAWTAFQRKPAGLRVVALRDSLKHDKAALRSLVLKQGYLYFDDPLDAHWAAERITLHDLFDNEQLLLQRGRHTHRLQRVRSASDTHYVHTDGPLAKRQARLLFADRVSELDLGAPLHRDLTWLSEEMGVERIRLVRLTETDSSADLRVGGRWVKAVLTSDGSTLQLACIAENAQVRSEVGAHLQKTKPVRHSMNAMRQVVGELVFEGQPFDRPRGEEGPDRDGELRPYWMSAYLRGSTTFQVDDTTYPVFRADGQPLPPQVCVDMVLDTYERAAGNWFRPRNEPRGRTRGHLDFAGYAIDNRRSVLGFGSFAESRSDLFEYVSIPPSERVPFSDRAGFFAYLLKHADDFAPGDVIAIQGLKRDNRIHQHAILLERVDPLTGFPYGLADQMKVVRQRTWEGIMAEAPKRSLLYRARPTRVILLRMGAIPQP